MINYWFVTRPKRKLNSIPEVLSTFIEQCLDEEWNGQRTTHLALEKALENEGLKRKGERRDQQGGGARTYKAWLVSLGLIFIQDSTRKMQLTLAGEALLNGDSPVEILKSQVLKYQFPSAYSVGRGVDVNSRFKIHPFIFLLKLLMDNRIKYLTEEEMAKIVIVEAENDSEKCYEKIVEKINRFRSYGDSIFPQDFHAIYGVKADSTNLGDVANTMMNWLEYTQLAFHENKKLYIVTEHEAEIKNIISQKMTFIDRPHEHEYYQRKYGIDPAHDKDTRNLSKTKTVTAEIIAQQQIIRAYIALSLQQPITKITSSVIDNIVSTTGLGEALVIETLQKKYPNGSISSFMTQYYEMAFRGRDNATEFEKATVELFKDVFGYEAKHIGPIGLTPDVLISSDSGGYVGIIDNKAYREYSISNDHHNRMVHNYIKGIKNYYSGNLPLGFFSYIAGGFSSKIDSQLKKIIDETNVHGSVINVHNLIELIQRHNKTPYSHEKLKEIFTKDRQILTPDF